MYKSYIKDFTTNGSWKIFQLLLTRGEFDEIVCMAADGHVVDAVLLEALLRLHKEDIIERIIKLKIFNVDESAKDFLSCYLGKNRAENLFNAVEKRQQEQKEALKQALAEERKEKLLARMEGGLTKDLFCYANETNQWQEVIDRFGPSAVYHSIKPYGNDFYPAYMHIPPEVLWSDGVFRNLGSLYHHSIFNGKTARDFCKRVGQYAGGPQALYEINCEKVDSWLIENGYKEIFPVHTPEDFIRLGKCQGLSKADWDVWYRLDSKSLLAFADERGLAEVMMQFKRRIWLLKHGYIADAIKC